MKIPQTMPYNSMMHLGVAPDGACPFITPDTLMSYCSTRLRGIDDQVQAQFAKQQQANNESSTLNDLLGDAALKLPSDDQMSDSNNASAAIQAAYNAIEARAAKLPDSDPMKQQLLDLANSLGGPNSSNVWVPNATTFGDGTNFKGCTAQQFKSLIIDKIGGIQKDINSDAELGMIQLQSLMSQRQQAIQICTNLVQSLGDQCNKIAENVGH